MENLRAIKRCWPIAEPDGGAPGLAAQFAALRGLAVRDCATPATLELSAPGCSADSLIATSFAALAGMPPSQRESLRAAVHRGATLYLRGGAAEGARHQLAPLVDASFTAGRAAKASSYRFTSHSLIPAALRGEEAPSSGALNCASDLSGPAEPILLARDPEGIESPVVFAYRVGSGAIICDVQPDAEAIDAPLIWRLADPHQRCVNISALIAVERAAKRDVSRPVPFNLTIDDIPLGYDYFNESRLEEFLTHIERRCASARLDCAWIPDSQWLSRRYVDLLKEHRAGFVWHGIHRHVDHQKLADPLAEMAAGKRAMAAIMERYGVELQPLIIFPYERAHHRVEHLLQNEGFLAAAEQPRHDENAPGGAEYLRYCSASCTHASGLRFLHRYEAAFLTRDRMLALAALGMPILAFGHPKDVRLRRLSRFLERGGSLAHFDTVLDFAAAKSLPGRSLEAIARELIDARSEPARTESRR